MFALLIKRKPYIFAACLLIGLGTLVAADWFVVESTSRARIEKIRAINMALASDMDRRINQVRDVLGTLDATRAISCDPADIETRTDAIMSVAQLKGLAVLAADGSQACSTPSMAIVAAPDFADSAVDLSPFERLDVVSLGQGSRLALRLQRKPANSPGILVAIIPLSELAPWLNQIPDRIIEQVQAKLSIGKRTLRNVSDDLAPVGAAIPILSVSSEGAVAEETTTGERVVLKAESSTYPLSITLSAPRRTAALFGTRRLVTDFVLSVFIAGLLAIVFLRSPAQDLGPSRFSQAIRRKEFDVVYRPTIDLHSGKLSGAIIEMRWRRDRGTTLPSTEFMPAVIRSGFELQMLRYALRRSQEDLGEAYKLRLQLRLKVTVDHETLLLPGFADQIRRSIAGSVIRANQLVLAVLPINEAASPDRSRAVLRELQRLGVQLEIRQTSVPSAFGQDAQDLTVSGVAIDVRLTQALASDLEGGAEQARHWIRDIVAACASTGIRVHANRIRSYEVVKQLKNLGIDEVEGDVIAPALTAGSFMALVTRAGLDRNDSDTSERTAQVRRAARL